MTTRKGAITGLGLSVPEKVLTNHDLEKMVDTSDEWIKTRSGISERRIAAKGQTASMLAIPAAKEALEEAGVNPKDLDLIVCATSTPDKVFPSTACLIQKGIGAADCAAFDLLAACSGFVYASKVANQFIKGGAKNVLVVASEIFSQIVDWEDRTTCVLFGDGSAAAVFSATDGDSGMIDSMIHADGEYGDFLSAGGKAAQRGNSDSDGDGYFIQMKGKETFKVAVKGMADVSRRLLEANGYSASDVDIVIPHQANTRIINAVAKTLGVPEEKMFINIDRYGNTSAASIPIAMYEANKGGMIKKGDMVLLVAFGGGLTWGASLIRW